MLGITMDGLLCIMRQPRKSPHSSANTAAKEGDVESRWKLNQPAPPLERLGVVVRGQQLKRLENCAQRVDRWFTVKRTLLTLADTSLVATTSFAVPIHNAARDVDLAGVQELLNVGADVNGWTALYNAARCCG